MSDTTAKKSTAATADSVGMELANETRFIIGARNVTGGRVKGITVGERGILPEPYWTAAEDAVYAVYHYETPIAWKVEDGTWYVPMTFYSNTTSKIRNSLIIEGLRLNGIEVEEI